MNFLKAGYHIFAYSLLVDERLMEDRCPYAIYAGRARLYDHRFVVNRHGVPTLQPAIGKMAFGVLWIVDSDELCELDYFEGVDQFFTVRRKVNVVDESQSMVRAEAYIAKASRAGLPKQD
ncbi:MAG: gamma-glutamylcyclotransferase family protein, partial [Anaerolineales bacterium]